jgi:prepilin-type N-terminal cleavage/methylation domain-containing protein
MNLDQQRQRRRSTGAGYTLLELLVVLALIAAAAAIVLPMTVRAYSGFKLRLAAASVGRLFQQAKSRAVFEGRPYLVIFPPSLGPVRELILMRDDGRTLNKLSLPAGVSLSGRRGKEDWEERIEPLPFYPDGTSDASELDLKNSARFSLRLEVDPLTGRARIRPIEQEQE